MLSVIAALSVLADFYMQRRFLRARNHDVQKAKAMFMAHVQWRKEFGADALDDFVFHERDAIISLYPQGYHKTDKMVILMLYNTSCLPAIYLRLPWSRRSASHLLLVHASCIQTAPRMFCTRQLDCLPMDCDCNAGSTNIHSAFGSGQYQKDI